MESKRELGNVWSKIQSELETGGLDELDFVGPGVIFDRRIMRLADGYVL